MYHKGWRYYRDVTLMWITFFVFIGLCGYALRHPIGWIAALAFWVIRIPFRNAFYFAHPYRRVGWIGETHLEFREITFPSRDGLTLFGRFYPARNHATIILLHGLGNANSSMLVHAEALVHAGYGVFMIDLRAHGSSDGDTSAFGVREADDVAGAVDYLLQRADVNGARIGVLGISLGAQAALRGALKTDKIRALVLEGLGPSTLSDHGGRPQSLRRWLNYPVNWLYYGFYEWMTRCKATSVLDVIGQLSPRPTLLIASGPKDISFSRLFFAAARDPKELWELPDGEHGAAILQDSRTYAQRVIAFFDKALK